MKSRLVLAAAVLASALRAEEGTEPIAVQPAGTVPVDVERRLVLDGLAGDIVLQLGKPGEIRFLSRKMGQKDEIPVALFTERGALVFRPPAGEPFTARTLQMSVPPEVIVRVQAPGGGKLTASGLRGGLEVLGRSLNIDARGLGSDVEMDLTGGTVVVSMVEGGARLRGSGYSATLESVKGAVSIVLGQGAATLRGAGSLDADIDDSTLRVERVTGATHVVARGGSIEAASLGQGGEFKLAGTTIALSKSKGDITVSSDSDVRYKEMDAAIHLDVYGGSVSGESNQGLLEVRARNAGVEVAGNVGPVRVQGDGLRLTLTDIGGETIVYATMSDLTLEKMSGALTFETDRGDVSVNRANLSVTAKVTAGKVRMSELYGTLNLAVDGGHAEVAWAALPDKDSKIVNAGGDVIVRFPSGGAGCRVEARSRSGRVMSDLPRVQVLDGDQQAQGWVGTGQRSTVSIDASGDVQLLGGDGAPAPGSE